MQSTTLLVFVKYIIRRSHALSAIFISVAGYIVSVSAIIYRCYCSWEINFIDETNDYTSTFNLKLSDLYESKEDSKPEILNMKFNIYLKIIVIFSLM